MIKSLKNTAINFFKSRKIISFLLFFILALCILILTKLSRSYTNTILVDIEKKNIPEEIVIINNANNKLKLTLTTHGFKWFKYYLKTQKITVDFEKDVTKTHTHFIYTSNKNYSNINAAFGKETKIESISPDTLYFKYDINAVKLLPVKHNISLNYMLGYNSLNGIIIQPDSIKIIGPKAIINSLKEIQTESIELNNLNKPVNKTINLVLDSIINGVKINTKTVKANIDVEKFTEGTIEVPIAIKNVPKTKKINYFPKTVKVSYYTSLNKFNTINKSEFRVVCDYNDVEQNNTYLTPKLIKQPENIKATRIHQQTIEYIISE